MSGQLLMSFYGDDFTGSTDAMESLARAGVRTLLFTEPPTAEALREFPDLQAVGVAGFGRTMSTTEMDETLPAIFSRLKDLGAPLFHYKVCSTFDSSPEIGSIGRAIDLGQNVFRSSFVPLVVGAPALGRFSVFGNLFARAGAGGEAHRLDRHPTMRHHPVTPMGESDLRIHLSEQTDKKMGLLDALKLRTAEEATERSLSDILEAGAEIVLFDVLYEEHLAAIGRLVWDRANATDPLFAVGSSGLGYALTDHWKDAGLLPSPPGFEAPGPVDRLIVVSGSCSSVTGQQISRAVEAGFSDIPLAPDRLVHPEEVEEECDRAVREAVVSLESGRSVVLHTCSGPDDPRIEATDRRLRELGRDSRDVKSGGGIAIGEALGGILKATLERVDLSRIVVAGGDTSGYVAQELDIQALEMAAPLSPGSPLCRIRAPGTVRDGTEIVFKGGQVGGADYFTSVLRGA